MLENHRVLHPCSSQNPAAGIRIVSIPECRSCWKNAEREANFARVPHDTSPPSSKWSFCSRALELPSAGFPFCRRRLWMAIRAGRPVIAAAFTTSGYTASRSWVLRVQKRCLQSFAEGHDSVSLCLSMCQTLSDRRKALSGTRSIVSEQKKTWMTQYIKLNVLLYIDSMSDMSSWLIITLGGLENNLIGTA